MSVNLAERRKELGMGPLAMSKKLGISRGFLYNIERGATFGSEKTRRKLAEVLGVKYEEIPGPSKRKTEAPKAPETPPVKMEPDPIPKIKKWTFEPGREYRISPKNGQGTESARETWHKRLIYIRDEGPHHVFKNPTGGWRECFTDVQLMDCAVA